MDPASAMSRTADDSGSPGGTISKVQKIAPTTSTASLACDAASKNRADKKLGRYIHLNVLPRLANTKVRLWGRVLRYLLHA